MSMPTIPDIKPDICVNTKDAANIILSSIGLEELGLAHIINAEGEKMQSFLGTLDGQKSKKDVSIQDLEKLDCMVNNTLNSVIKKELLLLMKLDTTKELLNKEKPMGECNSST